MKRFLGKKLKTKEHAEPAFNELKDPKSEQSKTEAKKWSRKHFESISKKHEKTRKAFYLPPIERVTFILTNRCNFKCKYCLSKPSKGKKIRPSNRRGSQGNKGNKRTRNSAPFRRRARTSQGLPSAFALRCAKRQR